MKSYPADVVTLERRCMDVLRMDVILLLTSLCPLGSINLKKRRKINTHQLNKQNNLHYILVRRRRSHMPYLGQNLDKLGVIRVKPNWDTPPEKKNKLPAPTLSRFMCCGRLNTILYIPCLLYTSPSPRDS